MPSATCPHCQAVAQITYFPMDDGKKDSVIVWLGAEASRFIESSLITSLARLFTYGGNRWRLGRCENFQRPIFLLLDYYYPEKVNRVFPLAQMEPHPDISKKQVGSDYVEARLCLGVGAFKGAAVLCRRALQGAAIDKGAKKDKLTDQLDELAAARILTPMLADLAHNIRLLSNFGAHPGDDGLDDLSSDEAKALCDLTWQILEHLYVVPAESARIKKAIQAKKARPKKAVPAKPSKP
jgi:hypothetical protein